MEVIGLVYLVHPIEKQCSSLIAVRDRAVCTKRHLKEAREREEETPVLYTCHLCPLPVLACLTICSHQGQDRANPARLSRQNTARSAWPPSQEIKMHGLQSGPSDPNFKIRTLPRSLYPWP